MHWYHLFLLLVPLAGALLCLAVGRISGGLTGLLRGVVVVSALITLGLGVVVSRSLDYGGDFDAFSSQLVASKLGLVATGLAAVLTVLAMLTAVPLAPRLRSGSAAFHALLLFALAGVVLASLSADLIGIVVGVELTWLAASILPALLKTEHAPVLAASRQLVWSGTASALTLFGAALLAGLSGGTRLSTIEVGVSELHARTHLVAAGVALVLLAIGFGARFGLPPLGRGVVGMVEAGPAGVVAAAAGLGVLAGFVGGSHVIGAAISAVNGVDPVTALPTNGSGFGVIGVLAALALLIGVVQAFRAASMQQLLGAVITVQAGLLLLPVLAAVQLQSTGGSALLADPSASASGLFFVGVQTVLWVGLLGVLAIAEATRTGEAPVRPRPEIAVPLLLGVACVAGAPPLAGFFARLLIFQSAVIAGYTWLMLLALAAGLLLLIPAFRVLAPMFSDSDLDRRFVTMGTRTVAIAFAFITVLLPVLAQPLLGLAALAAGPGTR